VIAFVCEHTLEYRLLNRWLKHGLNSQDAKNVTLINDLPNTRYVIEKSSDSDTQIFHFFYFIQCVVDFERSKYAALNVVLTPNQTNNILYLICYTKYDV